MMLRSMELRQESLILKCFFGTCLVAVLAFMLFTKDKKLAQEQILTQTAQPNPANQNFKYLTLDIFKAAPVDEISKFQDLKTGKIYIVFKRFNNIAVIEDSAENMTQDQSK